MRCWESSGKKLWRCTVNWSAGRGGGTGWLCGTQMGTGGCLRNSLLCFDSEVVCWDPWGRCRTLTVEGWGPSVLDHNPPGKTDIDGECKRTCIYFIGIYTDRLRSNDTLVPIITLDIQILISKYHFPIERIRLPWRNDWFQGWDRKWTTRAWNILWWQK